MAKHTTDLLAENHGTIFLLRPTSMGGKRWLDEHICKDHQESVGAIVVEQRYILDIVCGAVADGLRVR